MSQGANQCVWFKKDLRILDHAPLVEALKLGPVCCLYIYEPEIIHSAEFEAAHLLFINQSLEALESELRARGGALVTRVGEATEVLEELRQELCFQRLWSHQETGQWITYQRDLRVASWAKRQGVDWQEFTQTGVIRRLASRQGWAQRWEERMRRPVTPPPPRLSTLAVKSLGLLGPPFFHLPPSHKKEAQRGGEALGWACLESFLESRGLNYRAEMSSPLAGATGCSRLSPYLTWGCLSLKCVAQRVQERVADLRVAKFHGEVVDRRWLGALRSFSGRLHWHCHFMQKLEDEPRLEFENMARSYDGLREASFNEEFFSRWCAGQTGYPMVDACMRALHATGWINFRMRAMLTSFASYHLWLPWQRPAQFLARHFLDFEPGIHYSQIQIQSGVTGINTVRIYSPIKQALDQDPEGVFIKRYVPELAMVPKMFLAEPQRMTPLQQQHYGCRIGQDYPAPVVDHVTAYREARAKIAVVRQRPAARAEAQQVFKKHGSRKRRGGVLVTQRAEQQELFS
jgi:deoxyribodipyrimidine photo-lyase